MTELNRKMSLTKMRKTGRNVHLVCSGGWISEVQF